MRKTVALFVITALPLAAWPLAQAQDATTTAANAPASKAHVLTRAELDKLLAQPDKVLIIDVRRPDEISAVGGLPVYLSVQISDLEHSLAFIPKDRIIVTLSNHSARAGRAADLLASHGFKVAGAAGAETYEKEGGHLTHVAPQPPGTTQGAAGPH